MVERRSWWKRESKEKEKIREWQSREKSQGERGKINKEWVEGGGKELIKNEWGEEGKWRNEKQW